MFATSRLHIDIWPRVQKSAGFFVENIEHAVRVLDENRIYADFRHYIYMIDVETDAELITLCRTPLVIYQAEKDHLWVFVGLLRFVCDAFYMPFNPEDEVIMYPYRVMIPTGPDKAGDVAMWKSSYEMYAKNYSRAYEVITRKKDELWQHKDDADWIPLIRKRWAISEILWKVLSVAEEIHRVQLQAFLEHPEIKS